MSLKNILFILLFFGLTIKHYAQDKTVSADEIFTSKDSDFDVVNFPEQWKQESAVILSQKLVYNFDRKGGKIINKEIVRKRIKLLDKSAVNEFSEFYFVSTQNIGINIIKPDGRVQKIDLKDAVSVSEEISIPYIYKSNTRIKREYKKLAIPGIEINDIIDYYYNYESKNSLPNSFEFAFPEIFISLSNVYPTLKQNIEFQVEKGFNINFRNQNGAPDLKEKASPIEGILIFYFEDVNREKANRGERWNFLYRNTPTIKFQVVYTKNGKNSDHFIGLPGIPKKSLSDAEILEKVQSHVFYHNGFTSAFTKNFGLLVKNYKKENELKTVPNEFIVKQAYFFYRHFRYLNPTGSNLGSNFQGGEDVLFAKTMFNLFKIYKIDCRIILAPPAPISGLSDVVMKAELQWMVKVGIEGGIYLYPPSICTAYKEISDSYEGVTCYEVNTTDAKTATVSKSVIPHKKAQDHCQKIDLVVIPVGNFEEFHVNKKTSLSGFHKEDYSFMIYAFDVWKEEYFTYHDVLYPIYYSYGTDNAEYRQNYQKKVEERLKNEVSNDFELVNYESYYLNNDGRGRINKEDTLDSKYLSFSEAFSIKGIYKKAGTNYLFDVGRLLGGQVEIAEKELDRKFDINYTPRNYISEIKFKIPEGYTIEGIENLNMNVSNATGHFISSAIIENSYLIIKTSKEYSSHFEKKEDWSKVVEFLNAAYKFTQVKVLIKKNKEVASDVGGE